MRSWLVQVSTVSLLISALHLQAMPPDWWFEPQIKDKPAAVDENAAESNSGVATVGQAKWMAQSALAALEDTLGKNSPVVTAIKADLFKATETSETGVFYPVRPTTPSEAWLSNQKAPLQVGALKALAQPFYEHICGLEASWVAARLAENGLTLGSSYFQDTDGVFYPWNPAHNQSTERNQAVATVGQLKLVFALDFGGDYEEGTYADQLPDLWEYAIVNASPTDGWTSISQINGTNATDASGDTGGSNPPNDRDGDKVPNLIDADPDDSEIDWRKSAPPAWVSVRLADLAEPPSGGLGYAVAIGDGGSILTDRAVFHGGAWHALQLSGDDLEYSVAHDGHNVIFDGENAPIVWSGIDAKGVVFGTAGFQRTSGAWDEDENWDPEGLPSSVDKVIRAAPPNYTPEVIGTTGSAKTYSFDGIKAASDGVWAAQASDVAGGSLYRSAARGSSSGISFYTFTESHLVPYSVGPDGQVVGSLRPDSSFTETPFYRKAGEDWQDTSANTGLAVDVTEIKTGGESGDKKRMVMASIAGRFHVRREGETNFRTSKPQYTDIGETTIGAFKAISQQGWVIGEVGLGSLGVWVNGEWHNLDEFIANPTGVNHVYPTAMNNSGAVLALRNDFEQVVLLPIEVVDKDLNSLAIPKVAKMTENGVISGGSIDPEKDSDRFYVRLANVPDLGDISVNVATSGSTVAKYNDNETEVELAYSNGVYQSQSMVLVSDEVDDGGATENQKNDRTHIVQLGGKLEVKSVKIGGNTKPMKLALATKTVKTFKVHIIKMGTAAEVLVYNPTVIGWQAIASERYAQIGVELKFSSEILPYPSSDHIVDVENEIHGTRPGVHEEARKIIDKLPLKDRKDYDVCVYIVEDFHQDIAGRAITPRANYIDAHAGYLNNALVSLRAKPFTLAHEIGHILTNNTHWGTGAGHYPNPFPTGAAIDINLMKEGTDPTNVLGASKRLEKVQEQMILENRLGRMVK